MFSREIRTAPFPPRFRQPTTLVKYSGETDPVVWLNDYRLACQLGGATDDAVIIRNLPLHLADATTNYAADEEAVGAIFDGKANKRKEAH